MPHTKATWKGGRFFSRWPHPQYLLNFHLTIASWSIRKKNSKLRKTVFFSFFLYCFGQQTSIWQSGVVYSERKWRCWLFCVHTNDTCCLSPKHLLTLLLRQEDAFLSCHGTHCWYLVLLSSLSFQVTPWGHVVYLSLPKLVDICRQMIPTLCFIDHTT